MSERLLHYLNILEQISLAAAIERTETVEGGPPAC